MITYRNEGFNRLRKREQARTDGRYSFRWTDMNGKRHYIYGRTLEELRWKEKEIEEQLGIDRKRNYWRITVNDIYVLWKQLKRGIRNNTTNKSIGDTNLYQVARIAAKQTGNCSVLTFNYLQPRP